MASEDHLATLRLGIPAWNDWRAANPAVNPDLSRADLHGTDFTGANLERTNFARSGLAGSKFGGARVNGATFRQADLTDADLGGALGVSEERFAGANLAGAQLPDAVRLLQRLGRIEEIYGSCQQIFLTLFVAALYTWLTIAATTHARLLSDTASSPLPIVGTPIPIAQFYIVAPFVVLVLFVYLHLSLQRLWNHLAGLPAVFPDGERLDQKSYPRVLSSFIRTQCALLRPGCPPEVRLLTGVLSLFVWGGGAFLVGWVWWQYLPRRELVGSLLLLALLIMSVVLGVVTYRVATSALRGTRTRLYREALVALLLSAGLLGSVFAIKLDGQQPDETANRCVETSLRTVAGVWALVRDSLRCRPLANLRQADLSVRPPAWKGSDEENWLVQGATLRGKDLSYAQAAEAFLVKADLSGATLQYANLQQARLQRAILRKADLTGASLLWASLKDADLRGAILVGAVFREANLAGVRVSWFNNCSQQCFDPADLKGATFVRANLAEADLKEAILDRAYFDSANLSKTSFSGASLVNASFRWAILQEAQFSAVTVQAVDACVDAQNSCAVRLEPSNVAAANLSSADLLGADLTDANLTGVNFQGADLRGATGLTLAQLATVKTLYQARLDKGLLDQVTKAHPHLLQQPR
jgi:uncharacterized protein YjbI with pentapeptide repeats